MKDSVANAQPAYLRLVLILVLLILSSRIGAQPTSSTLETVETDEADEAVKIRYGDPTSPLVALTFDDAPDPVCIPPLLALLREHKVKATFFLIGKHLRAYPELARAIVADGHEIGNHSMNHLNSLKVSGERVEEEIVGMQRLIHERLGVVPTLYRPAYGTTGARLRQVCAREKLRIICWNVDPRDWQNGTTRESIVKNVLENTTSGSIVVLHATRLKTIDAVGDIIPALRARGFRLATVSELLKDSEARVAQRRSRGQRAEPAAVSAGKSGGASGGATDHRFAPIRPPALPPL